MDWAGAALERVDRLSFFANCRCRVSPHMGRDHVAEAAIGGVSPITRPNLTARAEEYLKETAAPAPDLFAHALAILSAPAYADENQAALGQGWPRVPLPRDGSVLASSASLGRALLTLLDAEAPAAAVTQGRLRPELRLLAVLVRSGQGPLDTSLSAGWGYSIGHAVMPGQGMAVERAYTPEELTAFAERRSRSRPRPGAGAGTAR